MRSIKITVGSTDQRILWILLFFAGMNFQAKFFYLIFAATAMAVLIYKNRTVNSVFLLYVLFAAIMLIYNLSNGIKMMLKCIAYPFAYYIGLSLCSNLHLRAENQHNIIRIAEKRVYQTLVALSLGAFAHYMANYFFNLGNNIGRNTTDIWTGEALAATGQSTLACLMLGLAISMLFFPLKKWNRVFGFSAIIGIMLYNLTLATRTGIVIVVIVFAIGAIYYLAHTSKNRRGRFIKYMLSGLGVILVVWFFDIGGIKTYIQSSNLYLRFIGKATHDLLDTDRTSARISFLRDMWKYPLGGSHMHEQYGYAHDLLLDAFDEYGITIFGVLIAILIDGIKNVYFFCKNQHNSMAVKSAYLCVYSAVLLEFCVEPILVGMPWLLACYCFMNGALYSINRLQVCLSLGDCA